MHSIGVSVVVPFLNRSSHLPFLIASVKQQDIRPIELLIIDNGSTVEEMNICIGEILRPSPPDFEIRIISSIKRNNANVARNLGASIAKHRYIAFLDSDDSWEHEHLTKSIETLHRSNVGASFSDIRIRYGRHIASTRSVPFNKNTSPTEYLFVSKGSAQTSSFVVDQWRTPATAWDERLLRHQDYDYFLTVAQSGHWVKSDHFGPVVDRTDSTAGRNFHFKSMIRFYKKWQHLFSPAARSSYISSQIYVCKLVGAPARYTKYYRSQAKSCSEINGFNRFLISHTGLYLRLKAHHLRTVIRGLKNG